MHRLPVCMRPQPAPPAHFQVTIPITLRFAIALKFRIFAIGRKGTGQIRRTTVRRDLRSIPPPGDAARPGAEVCGGVVRHLAASGDGVILYAAFDADTAGPAIQAQVADFRRRGAVLEWIAYAHRPRPPDLGERLEWAGLCVRPAKPSCCSIAEHMSARRRP